MVLVRCLYGACKVLVRCLYGEKPTIVQCFFGACVVHVWCIHDQDYSKEEQQTRPSSQIERKEVVLSNRETALVNKMVLKATLF